jgi:hypothetical protein
MRPVSGVVSSLAAARSWRACVDLGLRRDDVYWMESAVPPFNVIPAKAGIQIRLRGGDVLMANNKLQPAHFWPTGVDGRLRGHDVLGKQPTCPSTNVIPAKAGIHASFSACNACCKVTDA